MLVLWKEEFSMKFTAGMNIKQVSLDFFIIRCSSRFNSFHHTVVMNIIVA